MAPYIGGALTITLNILTHPHCKCTQQRPEEEYILSPFKFFHTLHGRGNRGSESI
ncbi:hypothetical protein TSMEX_009261 [Taenia solium]|eukprot:TsM_000813400 transcript=TsM_000813400 gene=TsM_000813400